MRGVLLVTCAASAWGLWSLFLRATTLPGPVTSMLMLACVGLFALPVALRQPPPRWDRATVVLLAALAVADAGNMITFFAALDHTSVAIAVLTHYLAPVLVALSSPWVDGSAPRGARAAAAVALAGLVLLLEPWRAAPKSGAWLGAALGATSAIGYAAYVFIMRRLGTRLGAARALSYHALLGALLLLPFAAGGLATLSLHDLALMATGSLLLGVVAGLAFIAGLTRLGSARAAVLTFAEPLVAVLVGWLAFDEQLSLVAALGGALVLGAGVYVARSPGAPS